MLNKLLYCNDLLLVFVQDKNFVVIMGIEDLEQQISDLKNKISLLEATVRLSFC